MIEVHGSGMVYVHTVKPEEDAHTLVPSLLKIAALSKLPVPTRLSRSVRMRGGESGKAEVVPSINVRYQAGESVRPHASSSQMETNLATTF